jgi:hypothetical protein
MRTRSLIFTVAFSWIAGFTFSVYGQQSIFKTPFVEYSDPRVAAEWASYLPADFPTLISFPDYVALPCGGTSPTCWVGVLKGQHKYELQSTITLPMVNIDVTRPCPGGLCTGKTDLVFQNQLKEHELTHADFTVELLNVTYGEALKWSKGYRSNPFNTPEEAMAAARRDIGGALIEAASAYRANRNFDPPGHPVHGAVIEEIGGTNYWRTFGQRRMGPGGPGFCSEQATRPLEFEN